MGLLILLLMIGVPIIEIAVFIEVGGRIGVVPTVATVIVTAMIGTALLRQQGFAVLARVRESLAAGRFPIAEVFDGLCLLVAGALLLTPGFVTDAIGLLLFVPPIRAALRRIIGAYFLSSGRVQVFGDGPEAGFGPARQPGGPTVIDGEFEEIDEPGPDGAAGDTPSRDEPPGDNPWRGGSR